jgi:hypothetical protein
MELDDEFQLTRYAPSLDTYGRTPEYREKIPFWAGL